MLIPNDNDPTILWVLAQLPLASSYRCLLIPAEDIKLTYALATKTNEVVAIDVDPKILMLDKTQLAQQGINNVEFSEAVPTAIPYADKQFDLIICQFALHNFLEPSVELAEMYRVCKQGGYICIIDVAAPESDDLSESYNYFARLRDPAHIDAHNQQELAKYMQQLKLTITHTARKDFTINVKDWLAAAQTDAVTSEQIKEYLVRELNGDNKTGLRPLINNNEIMITQTWIAMIGKK